MDYTSIKQSKKLLELGLSPKTSDCNWQHAPGYENYEGEITGFWDEPKWGQSCDSKDLPCWSLGALLGIMPKINFELFWESGHYVCRYTLKKEDYISYSGPTPIKAVFDMMVWLLKKGYIKTENK